MYTKHCYDCYFFFCHKNSEVYTGVYTGAQEIQNERELLYKIYG